MVRLAWKDEARRYVCEVLAKHGALQFGIFKLTSGKMSPYYVDLRIIPSFPKVFKRICEIYLDLAKETVGLDAFDRIAGIPTAGIPFASVIAYQAEKPFLYIREEAKPHGRERSIEGILMPGERVLIIDDLITTGKSILRAAKILRGEGAVVDNALVLLDREEGGSVALSKEGIRLRSLMSITEAAQILYDRGIISEENYRAILRQIKRIPPQLEPQSKSQP
ncbi:MAG: orotate phosphoribosyltransferase [Candidatus Bathyarchaeia archaeon]